MQTPTSTLLSFFIDTHVRVMKMHRESKKDTSYTFVHVFIKIISDDFKHSFTGTLSNKFAIKLSLKNKQPPDLKRVGIL